MTVKIAAEEAVASVAAQRLAPFALPDIPAP